MTKPSITHAVEGAIGGEAVDISGADHTATQAARAIYIGGAGSGNLKVDTVDGSTLTLAGVTVGILPIQITKVYQSGTDTTNMVLLW